jgi:ParB/RepB/Spo0J family partition protein
MLVYVPLEQIDDNPFQERQDYTDVGELAGRIYAAKTSYPDTFGLMQVPRGRLVADDELLVPTANLDQEEWLLADKGRNKLLPGWRVQLAFGHRRKRAFDHIVNDPAMYDGHYYHMPIHIDDLDDDQMLNAVWSENRERKDISAVEEARLLARKLERVRAEGGSQRDVADEWGLARSTVANRLRLLELPADIQEYLHTGKISERQALALLPIYQLPAAAQETLKQKAAANYYLKSIDDIVDRAIDGSSSDSLREWTDVAITAALSPLDGKTFPPAEQIAEGNPDVRQSHCPGCEMIVKRGGVEFCGDKACFDTKADSWRGYLIGLAQTKNSGLKALDENKVSLWEVEDFGYVSQESGQEIITAGCPRDSLRLYYDPVREGGIRAGGVPEVRVVCAKNGRPCYCLQAKEREARAEQPPDPAEVAEKEAKKQLEQTIVQPAVDELAKALANMEPEAWRVVLKKMTYGLQENSLNGDWDKLIRHVARRAVSQSIPWHGWEHLDKARDAIDAALEPAGIAPAYPELTPEDLTPGIRRRFARVNGWIDDLTKNQPTAAALRGNIENLERIQAELDSLPNEQVEEIFYGQVGIALNLLRELLPVCTDNAANLTLAFEHVPWLITVPPGDINFKSHLKHASAGALRYTLAIVRSYGDGGHKVRRERLEARLRQVDVDAGAEKMQARQAQETAVSEEA